MANTNHMMMLTSLITISLRQLKKSAMGFPCSPIWPRMIPNAMQNEITPARQCDQNEILHCLCWRVCEWAGVVICQTYSMHTFCDDVPCFMPPPPPPPPHHHTDLAWPMECKIQQSHKMHAYFTYNHDRRVLRLHYATMLTICVML